MYIEDVTVLSNKKIAENTFLIEVQSEKLSKLIKPGQFFNIQVNNSFPLLRRPFSVADVKNNSIFFMYKVVGEGTNILSRKSEGENLNLLGPLGNFFQLNGAKHFILIGGGIGIAPFPFLLKSFNGFQNYTVLFGVRNENEVHEYGLSNIYYSSDNGTIGYKGNVIQLLENRLNEIEETSLKIFACGPNPMLRALQKFCLERNIECEVSMESVMACGFGICQGCPIESKNNEAYKLICKDGPIFNIKDIEI